MQDGRYLLNLRQLSAGDAGEALFQRALDRVDRERREKVLRIRQGKARVPSLGAGLLLQKALADYPGGRQTELEYTGLQRFSVTELLGTLGGTVIEPEYGYGANGKPYFKDYPFHFNLSHSGDYVLCGTSGQELGVDIQKIQRVDPLRLAKRFFSAAESLELEKCGEAQERERMFFRLWARKEAYGKLTGGGLAGAMGRDFLAEEAGDGEFVWEEYDLSDSFADYAVAVCRRRGERNVRLL